MHTTFITARDGVCHSLNRFDCFARYGETAVGYFHNKDDQAKAVEFDFAEWEAAMQDNVHVVPAPPGYRVIFEFEDAEGVRTAPIQTVLAWRVTRTTIVPFKLSNAVFDGGDQPNSIAVIFPDGHVEDGWHSWSTLELYNQDRERQSTARRLGSGHAL